MTPNVKCQLYAIKCKQTLFVRENYKKQHIISSSLIYQRPFNYQIMDTVPKIQTFTPTVNEFENNTFAEYIDYMESQGAHLAGVAKVSKFFFAS